MALKPYSELVKVDVMPHCEQRKTKNERGDEIFVPYLNWAKCKQLLHENGAEVVYFEPVVNERTGSTLFMTEIPFVNSKGMANHCFEVRVRIVVDDLDFIQNYPLLNGTLVVRDDTMNQLRLSNAQARAFVKGVAIRTGLGFSLWVKQDETTAPTDESEDLSGHNILKVKDRVTHLLSDKLAEGFTLDEIAKQTKLEDEDAVRDKLKEYTRLYNFEGLLARVKHDSQ